jgi:tetraacyldisaccharide 4'-kinase
MIAGGTGKTPMVAWIARELSEKYRVAILSRGYGRRTRGFLFLDNDSNPEIVGDEPMELRLLLPGIPIAVDGNRKRGIGYLVSGKYGKVDLILMDDGFQHRSVTPGYAIVLDDFNRPCHRERLLPAGLLREPLSGLKRASQIIITKKQFSLESIPSNGPILLITGIADPQPLVDEITRSGSIHIHLKYPDHHRYTPSDAASIRKQYLSLLPEDQLNIDHPMPILLTTGKDYVKLSRLPELMDLPLQWIPIGPPVNPDQKKDILNKLYQYVEKTCGNS